MQILKQKCNIEYGSSSDSTGVSKLQANNYFYGLDKTLIGFTGLNTNITLQSSQLAFDELFKDKFIGTMFSLWHRLLC